MERKNVTSIDLLAALLVQNSNKWELDTAEKVIIAFDEATTLIENELDNEPKKYKKWFGIDKKD